MREFFRGWRRKAGCATLLMACALAGLWIRTTVVADFIQLEHLAFGTTRGGIYWAYFQAKQNWDWETTPESTLRSSFGNMSLAEILRDELSSEMHYGYALYWWLVLPITLLSAYLILWKPRKRASPN
eukprot:TRINITY_DN156_c0_g1_i5.p2 TRINITY_DN156_c0_g1~~TRINITY_DN156_c0_g1_i5.p2  ORF type:complete len:127 (+),score=12.56 TRINITY_DN156_c0_g1_i5:105-485(+)